MTTAAPPAAITEPGIYTIPDDTYHADPIPGGSLSNSMAKWLIPPYTPAHFKARAKKSEDTDALRFGRAMHAYALGVGAEIVVVDAANWRTKAARETRDELTAAGKIPMLPHEDKRAARMATALRQNPTAQLVLNLENVKVEQSLFWQDPITGVWLRARIDIIGTAYRNGEPFTVLADYKTTSGLADAASFGASAATYGYDRQAAWYLAGVAALGLAHPDQRPVFLHVAQEKDEPHLASVLELDAEAITKGRQEMRYAINRYAECRATGEWPGHVGIQTTTLPRWAIYQHEEKELTPND